MHAWKVNHIYKVIVNFEFQKSISFNFQKNKKNNGCFYFRGNLLDLGRCIGVYVLVLGYNKNSLTNNIFFFTNHNMVIFSSLNHQEQNRLRIKAFHVKMTQTLLWALNRVGTSIYCNMKVLSFCKFRKYSIRQLHTHSFILYTNTKEQKAQCQE